MAESAESPSATGTADSGNASRTPASKDKHCPWCDQLFTSSSLGRHLDLYIKEKNPKPADGVHDIEEIRKMRSNITRRSARTSSVKRESVTPALSKASPTGSPHSDGAASSTATTGPSVPMVSAPPAPPMAPMAPHGNENTTPHRPSFRGLNESGGWPGSGVMRDLPAPSSELASRLDGGRRDSVRKIKTGIEHKEKMREAWDQGRAAELALREVLDSVRVATVRARSKTSPLPFDVFALTFPALVLACLGPPPTLYSTQPFPTHNSWSLDPPAEMQFHALVEYLREQYRHWQAEMAARPEIRGRHDSVVSRNLREPFDHAARNGSMVMSPSAAHEQEERVMKHALDAYNHWNLLSEAQKHDSWRLEILRAYSREKEKRVELESRLEEALQDVAHCKAQVDRLSRSQQPREFLLKPPAAMPIAADTVKELSAASGAHHDWEYERLLSKWKGVVQDHRRSVSGMAGQRPLPPMMPGGHSGGGLASHSGSISHESGFHFGRGGGGGEQQHQHQHQHQHHGRHSPLGGTHSGYYSQHHSPHQHHSHVHHGHGGGGHAGGLAVATTTTAPMVMTNGGSTTSSYAPSPLNGEVRTGGGVGPRDDMDEDDPMEDVSPGPGPGTRPVAAATGPTSVVGPNGGDEAPGDGQGHGHGHGHGHTQVHQQVHQQVHSQPIQQQLPGKVQSQPIQQQLPGQGQFQLQGHGHGIGVGVEGNLQGNLQGHGQEQRLRKGSVQVG
ncbi:MAG: hypothetical protein M1823_000448 [Watsoniomyces obsoletus]|nr:MAG: hypothetical protein M1823_000448 [Watsoniomyces obsoletus]